MLQSNIWLEMSSSSSTLSKWATETHIYAMAQVLRKEISVHADPPYGIGYLTFEFKPTEGSVLGR